MVNTSKIQKPHRNLVITLLHALFSRVYENNAFLYMILNTARDQRIYPMLLTSDSNYYCLFEGTKKDTALYLVRIKPTDPFFLWCCDLGLTQDWMVFFTSIEKSLKYLGLYFKNSLLTDDPHNWKRNVHYYDARVLPAYLQTCNFHERKTIFKVIIKFWVPQQDSINSFNITQFNADGSTESLLVDKKISKKFPL